MKLLSDGSQAKIGLNVKILKGVDGLKTGENTMITAINEQVINKSNHIIDLNRWHHIVQCSGGWLININQLAKALK